MKIVINEVRGCNVIVLRGNGFGGLAGTRISGGAGSPRKEGDLKGGAGGLEELAVKV